MAFWRLRQQMPASEPRSVPLGGRFDLSVFSKRHASTSFLV